MASAMGMLAKAIPVSYVSKSKPLLASGSGGGGVVMVVECSSRPKKKATSHHNKTRPKKSHPWDIKRKPIVYPPLPALPPDWTLVSEAQAEEKVEGVEAAPATAAAP